MEGDLKIFSGRAAPQQHNQTLFGVQNHGLIVGQRIRNNFTVTLNEKFGFNGFKIGFLRYFTAAENT